MTDRKKTVTHGTTGEGERSPDPSQDATTRPLDDAWSRAVEISVRTTERYEGDEVFEAYPTVH